MKRAILILVLLMSSLCLTSTNGQTNTNGTSSAGSSNNSNTGQPTWFSPEVQVRDIIATFAALIALASLIWGIRKDKETARQTLKANNAEAEAAEQRNKADQAEAKATALATRLFYKARAVFWKLDINLDGSLKTTCRWDDVEVLPPGANAANIPGELWYAPPDCQVTTYPALRNNYSIRGAATNLAQEVKLEPYGQKNNGCNYNLRIVGALPQGYHLSYEYEAIATKGVFMTKEDVDQNAPETFKKEYWGHYVVTPIDEIEIVVSFPEGYNVKAFAGVYIGADPSEDSLQREELQRILTKGRFEDGGYWARLKVPEPFVGFSYVIYWEPPGKFLVDALRQQQVPSHVEEGGGKDAR